jgi:hypothetical protein
LEEVLFDTGSDMHLNLYSDFLSMAEKFIDEIYKLGKSRYLDTPAPIPPPPDNLEEWEEMYSGIPF